MYSVDMAGAEVFVGYSDVFKETPPNLKKEIEKLNVHKAISIICELIRVRNEEVEPIHILGYEFRLPFETVLKKEMCKIEPKSSEEMFSNPLMRKDVHIISLQTLLLLLKKVLQYGNMNTLCDTDYTISKADYEKIIELQLVVIENLSNKHKEKIDLDHFLYSTYHLNYQRNVANELERMYFMMEKLGKNKSSFDEDVQREYKPYYTDFEKKYGFTTTQFSFLLFWELREYYSGINGLVYRSCWNKTDQIYGKTALDELAQKVLASLSKNADEYCLWARETEDNEWDFSEFFSKPFISNGTDMYISVCDVTLRNAFFEGLFWMIRNCYPEDDSSAMAFFGRLYEKYLQNMTESAVTEPYIYIEEFEFGKGNIKSSDAYIRHGNNLLVVEMKGFSVLLNCMIKNEDIERNNRKLFVKPILQADRFLKSALYKKEEFSGVEEIYVISVTMDNINAVPNYFNAIHKEIVEKKQVEQIKYFFNFNIEEYEMLMSLVEKQEDIFFLLKDYFCREKLKPFGTYLKDKYHDIEMCSFMEKNYLEATEKLKIMYGFADGES